MKIKLFVGLMLLFVGVSVAHAEKIYLHSGKVLDTPIISRDHASITVKEGMVYKKYYNTEILKIDDGASDSVGNSSSSVSSKSELIIRFIEVSGIKRSLQNNFEQIIANVPVEKQAELRVLIDVDALINEILPIYDQYYTEDELRQLVDFYASALGQKVLETTPKLTRDVLEKSIAYFKAKAQPE